MLVKLAVTFNIKWQERGTDGTGTELCPMAESFMTVSLIVTVMRHFRTGIRSEKCVFRRFRRCANVIECTYTKLGSIAYYTPTLYGIAYCS
jgi:hypothetical protein